MSSRAISLLTSEELALLPSLLPYASERELTELETLDPGTAALLTEALARGYPSLVEFVHATWTYRVDPWQFRLCRRLQRLSDGETGQRLLVHAPPQAGKSIIVSQRFPAYYLGRKPLARVKLACYNVTRSERFGMVCQGIATGKTFANFFPGVTVPARQPRAEWSTTARMALGDGQPSFAALGLQTGFVGAGADLLLVDDPYKSANEAASEVIRESVWTFWDESARVRLSDEANVVVMFHRYHDDDLAGRLMREEGLIEEGGKWELLRFAAIADGRGHDPMSRPVGVKLSPRMRDDKLAEQQKSGFAWEGQFQGLPGRKGGNLFHVDQLRIVDAAPAQGVRCRGWDMAATEGAGKYTAGVKILQADTGVFYVEDVVRGQWDTHRRNMTVRQTAELDGYGCLIAGEKEGGSGGKDQARAFVQLLSGFNVAVFQASSEGSKVFRADPFSAQVNAGNVRLVRGDWNKAFIDEYRSFPLGQYSDQVDAGSAAFNRLARRVVAGAV